MDNPTIIIVGLVALLVGFIVVVATTTVRIISLDSTSPSNYVAAKLDETTILAIRYGYECKERGYTINYCISSTTEEK